MTTGHKRLALEEKVIKESGFSADIESLMTRMNDKHLDRNTKAFVVDVLHYYINKLETRYKVQMIETKRIINLYERQLK